MSIEAIKGVIDNARLELLPIIKDVEADISKTIEYREAEKCRGDDLREIRELVGDPATKDAISEKLAALERAEVIRSCDIGRLYFIAGMLFGLRIANIDDDEIDRLCRMLALCRDSIASRLL
jgi:hypothetical protein